MYPCRRHEHSIVQETVRLLKLSTCKNLGHLKGRLGLYRCLIIVRSVVRRVGFNFLDLRFLFLFRSDLFGGGLFGIYRPINNFTRLHRNIKGVRLSALKLYHQYMNIDVRCYCNFVRVEMVSSLAVRGSNGSFRYLDRKVSIASRYALISLTPNSRVNRLFLGDTHCSPCSSLIT